MIITIASGKGGTGKTSIAVNLAQTASTPVELFDCDVEEPNAHLFLQATNVSEQEVSIDIPEVDSTLCTSCDECVAFCQFNALASVGSTPIVFEELCHGCGGCHLICPQQAIAEKKFRIGSIRTAQVGHITLKTGRMDIGVSLASSLIQSLKALKNPDSLTILDAPPGTACPAVATLRGSDFSVLVTEATPFGLNDLKLAVETVRFLNVPFGVVINKASSGSHQVREYCSDENIPILMELADDRRIAETYSRGEVIVESLPEYTVLFGNLWQNILAEIKNHQQPFTAQEAAML